MRDLLGGTRKGMRRDKVLGRGADTGALGRRNESLILEPSRASYVI